MKIAKIASVFLVAFSSVTAFADYAPKQETTQVMNLEGNSQLISIGGDAAKMLFESMTNPVNIVRIDGHENGGVASTTMVGKNIQCTSHVSNKAVGYGCFINISDKTSGTVGLADQN